MSKFTRADALAMCRNDEQRAVVAAQLGEKPRPAATADVPKDRYRSKLERQYADWLSYQCRIPDYPGAQRIDQWEYEPVTLIIGGASASGRLCRYTPDFRVVVRDHTWGLVYQLHEVKGRQHKGRERGLVKLKAAARQYMEYEFYLVERDANRNWNRQRINP